MKICVYAICKNEIKFIESWLASMNEADYIVVLDTGSTDGTYEKLLSDERVTRVEQKKIEPWRFDVARNESMKLIPEDADVLVCTDFDEIFDPGWAKQIRENWKVGNTTRGHYLYAWSENSVGEPGLLFKYDKMHTRDYHWIFPVHEVVLPNSGVEEKIIDFDDKVYLHHHPDPKKSRAFYSELIDKAVEERPNEPHVRILRGRELYGAGKRKEALEDFQAVIDFPDIRYNRKESYLAALVFMMSIYYEDHEYEKLLECSNSFIKTDSTYFEPYLFMGAAHNDLKNYEVAMEYVETAKENAYRHYIWYELPYTFQGWPQEILANAYYGLGEIDKAIELMEEPLRHNPKDPRLLYNENQMLKKKIEILKKAAESK